MAKKSTDKNIRKITKIGRYSYGVTIPIAVMREFKWKERQKVTLTISKRSKKITIQDWKK